MAIIYNTSIVLDGLVLHLDAANVKSYPGSGTTWYDISNKGNNATLNGEPTITSGVVNFLGTDDKATISTSSGDFEFGTGDFSACIWIKEYGTIATYPHLFTFNDQNFFTLKAVRPGITDALRLYIYQGSAVTFSNSYLDAGTWQLISLVRTGGEYRLYINNTISDTVVASPKDLNGSTSLYLGWGWVSEYSRQDRGPVLMYNRALSSEEIKANFEAHRGRFGI